jgi:hypothetical protein
VFARNPIWSQEPDLVQELDLDQEPDLGQVLSLGHEPDLGQEPH